jgi:hypothetical protein
LGIVGCGGVVELIPCQIVMWENSQIGKIVPVLIEMAFPIAANAINGGSGIELST